MIAYGSPLYRGERFSLGYLFAEHLGAIAMLLRACQDYYQVLGYCPPSDEAARGLFEAVPESGLANKFLVGVFAPDGELIGLLCAYRDVPAAGEWIVALMLIQPAFRSCGLGSEVYRQFEAWAALSGARAVRVMVAQKNVRGIAFWRRMGFKTLFENPGLRYGDAAYTGVVMGQNLPAPAAAGMGGMFPIWRQIPAVKLA